MVTEFASGSVVARHHQPIEDSNYHTSRVRIDRFEASYLPGITLVYPPSHPSRIVPPAGSNWSHAQRPWSVTVSPITAWFLARITRRLPNEKSVRHTVEPFCVSASRAASVSGICLDSVQWLQWLSNSSFGAMAEMTLEGGPGPKKTVERSNAE